MSAQASPTVRESLSARRVLGWMTLAVVLLLVLSHADQRQAVVGAIGMGAFYASLAVAIVLTFRTTGVVNFSVGATAMYAGYVYNALRVDGELFLPPVPNPLIPVEWLLHALGAESVHLYRVPERVSLGAPQTVGASFAGALIFSALLGLALHFLVFKPLRNAPPLAKVVASIGVTLLLQATVMLRFTSTGQSVAPILQDRRINIAGVSFSLAQLVVAATVVAATIALSAVFKYSRFGLIVRGAAENERAAVLLGYSPGLLSAVCWVLSTLVAGTFGVLLASINGSLDPNTMPLLIVPALGAALFGRFTSLGLTASAGFALAMSQDWIRLLGTKDWFPKAQGMPLPGLTDALPLIVIVAVLVAKGLSLPSRDMLEPGRLPAAPPALKHPVAAVVMALLAAASFFLVGPELRIASINSVIFAIIALSRVVVTGFAGQISLGQLAFAGVSGFALAKVSSQVGISLPVGLLLGGLVAMVFGLLCAVPALRIRGVNLAVVTLAAAVAVEQFVFANPVWSGRAGGAPVGSPRLFGLELGPNAPYDFGDGKIPNPLFGVVSVAVLLGAVLLVRNIRRSRLGSHMLAVRSNERAAASIGVDPARTKAMAFAIAAFIAGLGGALQGYQLGAVTPEQFGAFASVVVLAFAYLGGVTSVTGAMFAGLLAPAGLLTFPIQHLLGTNSSYLLILGALGVLINTVQAPEGLAGLAHSSRLVGRFNRLGIRGAHPGATPSVGPAAQVERTHLGGGAEPRARSPEANGANGARADDGGSL
jgi:branched-chain amino acid transport system permease protein